MQRQRSVERPLRVIVEDAELLPLERAGSMSKQWAAEMGRLVHLSIPLSGMSVLTYLGRAITLSQVGALGSLQQSAMALGNTLFNITGLSLIIGMTSGAETFMGQAVGMGQHSVLGLVLQRAVMLSWAVAVLPLAAWTRAPDVLRLLGQKPDLAELAAGFVQLLSPALLLGGINSAVTLYLAMQGVVRPLTLVAAAIAALTPFINHLLITAARLGLAGAAVGASLLNGLQSALLIATAAWHNRQCPRDARPWTGFTKEAFSNIPAYLAVAVPGTGMMVVDWWAFEVLTLVAGLLPDARTAVGACGILFGIHVLCFFCVEGVGYAVKIRVSNLLGAGSAPGARRALKAGLCLGAAWAALLSTVLALAPARVAGLFSRDPKVVGTVVGAIPWLVAALCLGNASTVMSGALRGCGRQRAGFAINAAAFWGCGVPVASALALRAGRGVRGLWMGLAAGSLLQLVILAAVVGSQDWEAQVRRSRDLVRSQSRSDGGAEPPVSYLRPPRRGAPGAGGGGGAGEGEEEPLMA